MQIFMGYEQAAKPDAKLILGDPKKPGNWKDETYLAKKQELELKQMLDAPTHPAAGYCPRVCLIVSKTPAVTDVDIRTVIPSGCDVVETPHSLVVTCSDGQAIALLCNLTGIRRGEKLSIFGLNTLDVLRQLGWSTAHKQDVPSWIWNAGGDYDIVNIINLYSCSGAKSDTDMDVAQFVAHWVDEGIAQAVYTECKLVNPVPAQRQAVSVRIIAAAMGF